MHEDSAGVWCYGTPRMPSIIIAYAAEESVDKGLIGKLDEDENGVCTTNSAGMWCGTLTHMRKFG